MTRESFLLRVMRWQPHIGSGSLVESTFRLRIEAVCIFSCIKAANLCAYKDRWVAFFPYMSYFPWSIFGFKHIVLFSSTLFLKKKKLTRSRKASICAARPFHTMASDERPEADSMAIEDKAAKDTDLLPTTQHSEKQTSGFETAVEDLPANYFNSVYFWGTMVACGASFGSV